MIKAIRHFGIVVKDLEKELSFYRDLLGLKIVSAADESGEYLDNMLALGNVRVKTVKMSAESGPTLVELLKFDSHHSDYPGRGTIFEKGPSHFAFTVNDLDECYRRLTEAGVRFNSPPQKSPDGRAKVTFCEDPEGNLIELVEPC